MTSMSPSVSPRRSGHLAGLIVLLLVVGGLATLAPAQAAAPGSATRLQLAGVRASGIPTTSGTTVSTTLVLKNRTGARTSPGSARLYLRSNDGRVLGLGEVSVPAVAAGAKVPVKARLAAPARTPAGTYAVQACLSPRPAGRCRTSPSTVVIQPSSLGASPSRVDLGETPVGSSTDSTVTITNKGHARSGALRVRVTGDAFSVGTSECGPALDPGTSCEVGVDFAPDAVGPATGTLVVTGRRGATTSVPLSGTGTGDAALAISPSSAELDDTFVGGESDPVTFTVSNVGLVPTGVPDTSLGSESDDFEISDDTCTTALAPGATCTVSVVFTPDTAGAATDELTVSATPGGSVGAVVSGTGLAPPIPGPGPASLRLTPPSAAFGSEVVGDQTDPVTFTLTNDGDVASGTPTVTLGGPDAAQFTIVDNGCTAALPAGATCDVDVVLAPTTTGSASASLDVSASPGGADTSLLTGTGLAPARLTLDPDSADLGSELLGDESDPTTFTITNDGDVASGTPTVTLGGPDAAQFTIVDNGCTAAVPAGATCDIDVALDPTTRGAKTASLDVSASPGGTTSSTLTGTGLARAALSLTPDTTDLESLLVTDGAGTPTTLTLTNDGDVASGVPTVEVTGPDADQFVVDDSGCAGALPPGAACQIDVAFDPTSRGAKTASLDVSASPGGTTSSTLTGTGLAPARLTLDPDSADLGSELLGDESDPTTFTITNDGDVASGTPTVTLGGPDAAQFTIVDNGCTAAVPAGATCDIDVALDPTTRGAKTASLDVSASPGGTTSATLTGTGLAPAALTVTPATDFGSVLVGNRTSPQSVIVTNTGDVTSGVPSYALSGPDAAQFRLFGTSCLNPLQPGDQCQVDVQLAPTSRGAKTASVDVSASPGGTTSAALAGTGLAPARLTLAPTTADLGHVLVSSGASAPTTLTLTNDGDVAASGATFQLTGTDAGQFAVASGGCGTTLAAGASCQISVTFDPSSAGTKAASLVVAASPGGTASTGLTGIGDTPASLSISESSYDFGYSDSAVEQVFTISNSGSLPAGGLDVGLSGSGAFTISSNTCSSGVSGSGSCAVGVTYAGSSSTQQSATLEVDTPGGGTLTVAITSRPVALTLTPTSYDFGGVTTGSTSSPASFTLTNYRRTAITISSGTISGPYNPDYRCFGTVIAAGASCTFPMRFTPTIVGAQPGSIILRSAADEVTSTLSGTGLAPAARAVGPATTAPRSLTVTWLPTGHHHLHGPGAHHDDLW